MLTQIELTPDHVAALAELEKSTGESRADLLSRALDRALANIIEQQREYDELRASVERGRADIAAGRCYSHEEAMSRIRSLLSEKRARKE